jgi:cysteine desulfurase family protein (TIGR01976 family)
MSTTADTAGALASVEAIRARFPALARRHEGRPIAYFDGPGGTQVPTSVADAVRDYLLHHNANTHWHYATSQETDAAIAAARGALADYLGAPPADIAFGANMTTLTFHLSRAVGRGLGPGDEILVTELDHHANVDPWKALERDRGVTVKVVRLDPASAQLDEADYAQKLSSRTRLVALGAASNALGTINDVARLGALARERGALVFVDAVHYAAHRLVDVKAMGCDFLACSAYKFHGPHVGVLYARADLLNELEVPRLAPASSQAPERVETGTLNHEGIVGAAAAVDFLASLGGSGDRRAALRRAFAALHERSQLLVERLWAGLEGVPGVRLFGPTPDKPRTPTVSFTVAGRNSDDVAKALARRAVFVSNGDFYAMTAVQRLGQAPHGLVRAGAACYTIRDEIDRLVDGVLEIASGAAR